VEVVIVEVVASEVSCKWRSLNRLIEKPHLTSSTILDEDGFIRSFLLRR